MLRERQNDAFDCSIRFCCFILSDVITLKGDIFPLYRAIFMLMKCSALLCLYLLYGSDFLAVSQR